MSFLFYGLWIQLPFIRFNAVVWVVLVSLLFFVSLSIKKPEIKKIDFDFWTKIAFFIIILSVAQKLFVSGSLFFPPGEDIPPHLYRAQLIYLNEMRPSDSMPYFEFKSFNYPSASHALLASYRFFNYPLEKAMLYLGIFSHAFLALAVFILISDIFKSTKTAVFSVILVCFTSLGLHEYFLWGAFPALMSWTMVVMCIYYSLNLREKELALCLASSSLTHSFAGIVSVIFLFSSLLPDLRNWKKYTKVFFVFAVLTLPQTYFTLADYLEFMPEKQSNTYPVPGGEIPVLQAISVLLSRPSEYSFFSFLIPFSTMLWLLFFIGLYSFTKIKQKFQFLLFFVFISALLASEKLGFSGWQFVLPTRFLESLFIVYIVIYCCGINFFIEKKHFIPLAVFAVLFLLEIPYPYNSSVWARQRQEQWTLVNEDDMQAINFISALNDSLIVAEPRSAGQMIPYYTGKKIFYFPYYDACFALKEGNCFIDFEKRRSLLSTINNIEPESYKAYNATVFFKAHSVFPVEKSELTALEFNKTLFIEKGMEEIFSSGNSSVLKIA